MVPKKQRHQKKEYVQDMAPGKVRNKYVQEMEPKQLYTKTNMSEKSSLKS